MRTIGKGGLEKNLKRTLKCKKYILLLNHAKEGNDIKSVYYIQKKNSEFVTQLLLLCLYQKNYHISYQHILHTQLLLAPTSYGVLQTEIFVDQNSILSSSDSLLYSSN